MCIYSHSHLNVVSKLATRDFFCFQELDGQNKMRTMKNHIHVVAMNLGIFHLLAVIY